MWSRSGGRGTNYQVTSIGNYAFFERNGLTSVVIPSSVTNIKESAFEGCSGLTSVVIPSSVTSIGGFAFDSCISLTSVVIPSSVTIIGEFAFNGCSGLTSVTIENGVTSIEQSAFGVCSSLISIDIPSSVTSIGNVAFWFCSGLTSVTIGNGVTSIDNSAFYSCIGLTSIVVESGNPVYDSRNNCNAIIETASNTLIAGCKTTVIPSNVTSIGQSAFGGCSGLTSIEIPSSVTNIEQSAFEGCSGLTSITSHITDIFETGANAFYGCENATLYVPRGMASTYRSIADWNRISKIAESIALAMSCNSKGKVTVNDGVQFTNDVGEVSVYDGVDNTFVFTPEENCQLEQVLIDGLDVTLSVKNYQLTTKIHEGSKMIVTFSKSSGDMNGDGMVNISDVVALVNLILGQ
ncbi:MAG: leucine-rich repeat protein [Bacteroidaceae bacterium]|nr:leucine-rich repeat protein [Bacteroidaceae bacterium]